MPYSQRKKAFTASLSNFMMLNTDNTIQYRPALAKEDSDWITLNTKNFDDKK